MGTMVRKMKQPKPNMLIYVDQFKSQTRPTVVNEPNHQTYTVQRLSLVSRGAGHSEASAGGENTGKGWKRNDRGDPNNKLVSVSIPTVTRVYNSLIELVQRQRLSLSWHWKGRSIHYSFGLRMIEL